MHNAWSDPDLLEAAPCVPFLEQNKGEKKKRPNRKKERLHAN
jgi:hypothetical protein